MPDGLHVRGLVEIGKPRRLGKLMILVESANDPRKLYVDITEVTQGKRRRRPVLDRREKPNND